MTPRCSGDSVASSVQSDSCLFQTFGLSFKSQIVGAPHRTQHRKIATGAGNGKHVHAGISLACSGSDGRMGLVIFGVSMAEGHAYGFCKVVKGNGGKCNFA